MSHHILLADNQVIFRTGAVRVLSQESDVEITVQCSELSKLPEALADFRKGIVIFPSSFAPNLHELVDWIEKSDSRSIVIVEHGATLEDSLVKRLHGILLRSVAGPQLVDCVRRVAAGERYVHRATLTSMPSPDRIGARVLQRLTPKEIQIMALVAEGCKNREIAERLETKEQVVKNYLRAIFDKTGVSDRLELALFTIHHRTLADAAARTRTITAKSA